MLPSAPSDQPAPWRVIVGLAPIEQLLELVKDQSPMILIPQDPNHFKQVAAAINGHQHELIWLCPDQLAGADGDAVWHHFNDCRFDGLADLSTWSTDFPNLRLLRTDAVACVSLGHLLSQLDNANPMLKAKLEQGGGQLSLYCRDPIDILVGAGEVLGQFTEISWCPGIRPAALPESKLATVSSILVNSFFRSSPIPRDSGALGIDYAWQMDMAEAAKAKQFQALIKAQELTNSLRSIEAEKHGLEVKIQELARVSNKQALAIKNNQRKASAIRQMLQLSETLYNALLSKYDIVVAEKEALSSHCKELQNDVHNLSLHQQEQAEKIMAHERKQLEQEKLQKQMQGEKISIESRLGCIISDYQALTIEVERLQQELATATQLELQQSNKLDAYERDRHEQDKLQHLANDEKQSLLSRLTFYAAERESLRSECDQMKQELAAITEIQKQKNFKIQSLEQHLIVKEQELQACMSEQNISRLKLEEALAREHSLLGERDEILQESDRLCALKSNQDNLMKSATEMIDEMLKALRLADAN